MSTIYEIAQMAGTSPKTAARILAGGSPRSPSRAVVLECARKIGYVRNQQAANLRTGRSGLIGILVPYIDNPFYTKFLQEMHNALSAASYQNLIACSFGREEHMQASLRLFEIYNIDGLVIDISEGVVSQNTNSLLMQIKKRKRPVIVTGGLLDGTPYDHFHLNNKGAMSKVVRHLAARGYKTIGFIGGMRDNLNIQNRLNGLKDALSELNLGICPEWIGLGDPATAAVQQRAFEMLRNSRRPDAIACTSDMMAITVIKAANELGLAVPRDVAVVGFDDIEMASLVTPGLTTVRQPLWVMARDIASLLVQSQARTNKLDLLEKHYETELIIREST